MGFLWRKRLFLLCLPLLAAVAVWQIRIESDLNAFFTATDSEDARLLAGLLQSGELSKRYLLAVEPAEGQGAAAVGAFTSRLLGQLAALAEVEQVWPANAPPREWIDSLRAYAPYHARIFSLDPGGERDLFDPAGLAGRAEGLKQALLSPQGPWLKTIAKQDPLLLSLNGFKDMREGFERQASLDPAGGALILQSRPAALDSQAQADLQAAIRAGFEALNREAGGAFRLAMTGVPVFTVAAQAEIGRDVGLVSTLSSLGVVAVFLLLFHSFSALHWVMLVQAASFVVGTLGTAWVFGDVHSLTLALGASLIGICTDYPLHVLVHCAKHRNTPQAAAKLLWPSLAMGGLTTVIGYVALGLTGFPGFEQIAVFACASILASLGLTVWVLPALLGGAELHAAHLPGIAAWVGFCDRHRRALLGLFAASAAAACVALPQIRWMDDMQKLAVDMSELKRQDAAVRAHFASIEPGRFVLVRGPDLETALRRSEAAERRLQALRQAGVLQEYHGLFPWLVSEHLQANNAQAYAAGVDAPFQTAWRAALARAGLAVDKLSPLPAPAAEPLRPQTVLDSPVRHILSGQLNEGPGGVALSLWLGEHDAAKLETGLAGLEGVRYFSQKDELDRMAKQHRDRSLLMLAAGVAIMALSIWLQQRSVAKVGLTLLPSLASVLFIFATWAVLGEEVSFLHVIGLLLSVSLCVDYGIFFMDNRGHDTDITYHAIASSTLTTLASFGAMGLAKTPTLPILALSVSLGVSLGFLLCPLLIKSPAPP